MSAMTVKPVEALAGAGVSPWEFYGRIYRGLARRWAGGPTVVVSLAFERSSLGAKGRAGGRYQRPRPR